MPNPARPTPSSSSGPSASGSDLGLRVGLAAVAVLLEVGLGQAVFASFTLMGAEPDDPGGFLRAVVLAFLMAALGVFCWWRLGRRLAGAFLMVCAVGQTVLSIFGFLPLVPLFLMALVLLLVPRRSDPG